LNNIFKKISVVVLALLVQGCASNLMKTSDVGVVETPDRDTATIVFMRSSFVASAIGVELFEIDNGEIKFVGALPNGSKIAHKTTPGKKVYMAYGTAADFMIANVEGNKTYYAIVRPNWGTGGFAPTPVRSDGSTDYNMQTDDFSTWQKETALLEKKDGADKWFAKNKAKYLEIYNDYWARFQTKTESQKRERTIQLSDGV